MAFNSTPRKPNGVLPVGTNQTANDVPKAVKAKSSAQGKKVIVRRLPPGMTEDEYWAILGDEWKDGNGKVDWTRFHNGEISHDPSNPSTPARCYLHVMRIDDIPALAEVVQKAIWEDAKHTMNDPALVGSPYLESSSYQKIPTTKRRTDPRQGTIDQDPDFMAFLSSLTQDPAASKETDGEQVADDTSKTDVKVTTTPLIEYLKEKKANKSKEASNVKGGKHARHESQGGKTKEDTKKKGKDSKAEKADKSADKEKEKAKEPVKLLTKKAAAQEAAEAAKSVAGQIATSKTAEEAAPKSRRANIAAAAKILQRDLGLSPGSAHRRARQDAAKADTPAKPDSGKEKESKDPAPTTPTGPSQPPPSTSSAPPSAPTAPKAQTVEGSRRSRGGKAGKQNASSDTAKGKGNETMSNANPAKATPAATTPVILKRKEDATPTGPASTTSTTTSSTPGPPTGPKAAAGKATPSGKAASSKKGSGQPSVTPGVMRAFVKHANPSQGVTEPLLKQAMETFGTVTFVEIDKRKGFAYVDFGEHDSLVKAISASPISVAQGTVQVLERKETKKATPAAPTQPASEKATTETQAPDRPKRGGRGRGRRGGGTAGNSGSATAAGNAGAASESAGTSAPSVDTNTPAGTG